MSDESLRVGVIGARGRMGAETCQAVIEAEDMDLVAAVGRALETGQPQALPPHTRQRSVLLTQATDLPPIKPPSMVRAYEPSKG